MESCEHQVEPPKSVFSNRRSPAAPGSKPTGMAAAWLNAPRSSPEVVDLAKEWAKKYVTNLVPAGRNRKISQWENWLEAFSQRDRRQTSERLTQALRFVSVQAWHKTEMLLCPEIQRHGLKLDYINPWDIMEDAFRIYDKILDFYTQQGETRHISVVIELAENFAPLFDRSFEVETQQLLPSKLATLISDDMARLRQTYTQHDPRVIGFVSMQLHYTNQMLLNLLSPLEQVMLGAYFKVMDDLLYMPLYRAIQASAQHRPDSVELQTVQRWLPISSEIARRVCSGILDRYPTYSSYHGRLREPNVFSSSVRDVEMFQVYLWVCLLEGNISSVQEELFPLCVLLYPVLKVDWDLVRQMLYLLRQELYHHLTLPQIAVVKPYLQALWQMFSPQVVGDRGQPDSHLQAVPPKVTQPEAEQAWESRFGSYVR